MISNQIIPYQLYLRKLKLKLRLSDTNYMVSENQKVPESISFTHEFTNKEKVDKPGGGESEKIEGIKFIKHDISEDKDFDYKQILKMKLKKADEPELVKEFPKIIKHDTERKYAFREFLKTNVAPVTDKSEVGKGDHILDIFKSPEPLKKLVKERQKEKVVLKLDKK